MSTSQISDKNIIMASFDDVPKEVRKHSRNARRLERRRCRSFLHAT
jgi:hypothetical protein